MRDELSNRHGKLFHISLNAYISPGITSDKSVASLQEQVIKNRVYYLRPKTLLARAKRCEFSKMSLKLK